MTGQRNDAARGKPGAVADSATPRSRRLLRRGVAALMVVALLGLIGFYAPRYVARYLLASWLDELGVDYQGVETLTFNPLDRALWLGPMRFGAGPTDHGQLGELGLRIRIDPLLRRRVSIEQLLVRGIDVVVTRSKQGTLALNGIPLHRFIPRPAAAGQPAAEGDPWGAGVDTFELRDSRLIFQDRERGELEVDVERLALLGFRTWESERPGRFELAARVNDIQLNWSGVARPFADNITLEIDSRTEQADVPKLVRFTGPLDLARRDGTYDAQLKYQVTLFAAGGLEGYTVGTIDIKDADYERAGVFALTLERAKVDLDVRYTLNASGDFSLKGQVATDLHRIGGKLADKTRLAATTGRVVMRGLDTAYGKDRALRFAVRPDIDLEGVAFSGPVEISVNKLLELLARLQSLSAAGAVSTADTGLGDFADRSVTLPSSDVKVGRLRSKGQNFSLRSGEGRVDLDLKTGTDLFDVQVSMNDRRIAIERWQSLLERLRVTSGQGRFAVDMAGTNSLVAGTAASPLGEMKIGTLEVRVDKLRLEAQTDTGSLQLAAASHATGFSGLIYAHQALPEVQLHLGAAKATLGQASIEARGGTLRWQAAGNAAVDSLTADFAKGKEGALKFGQAEIEALQANEQLQFAADALTIDALDLYVKRSLLAALASVGGAGEEKGASTGDTGPQADVAAPATPMPATEVHRTQTLLTELGYTPGPVDGRMGRRTAAAISAFQRQEGLVVDGRPTGRLLAALEARAAGPAASDAAPAPRTDLAKPAGPSMRLGRVALTGNPVLRFRDDLVKPQVTANAVFKAMEVRNLNTKKTDRRTDLNVAADVNEFTHVELAGWIAGFGETADLDVKARVENLELSTYSPYVAGLAGVHLESGQLDATAAAKVEQGTLRGKIQLELDDMAFRPLSKEDAARVAGTVGVPLETAVDLLQDGDGRIALTLPVSGALNKPEVDVSSAVNKAIGGVLINIFPPTMVVSILADIFKPSGPAFEPIAFAPGSAELDAAGKRYADDVVKLLAEHPKLSLKVCGRSTAQDMEHFMEQASAAAPPTTGGEGQATQPEAKPELVDPTQAEQALIELAVERKRALRRYLIQAQGVDAKRAPECSSTFEAADRGSPRVEILL